jgi:hypothetical protein
MDILCIDDVVLAAIYVRVGSVELVLCTPYFIYFMDSVA